MRTETDSFPALRPGLPRRIKGLKGRHKELWRNQRTELLTTSVAREFLHSAPVPFRDVAERALALFPESPRSSKALLQTVETGEFASSIDFLLWAQFKALFLKSTAGGSEVSRTATAMAAFEKAERKCKRTNKRLAHYSKYPNRMPENVRVVFSRARGLISRCLGNFTEATLEQILDAARPGSGSAVGTRDRMCVSLPFKLDPSSTQLICTPEALPYVRRMVEKSPSWFPLVADLVEVDGVTRYTIDYTHVPYNRVGFVPKDAATKRTIAVEPALNMFLQLGVHDYVSRRLRAYGVDLSTQSKNQALARAGARDWATLNPTVTLDLSAASDSVSVELVRSLLPPVWVSFLDDIRSKQFVLREDDGSDPVDYQKWSSMGNGYTFVLETLIFWALAEGCRSLCDDSTPLAVYGDDIAIGRCSALLLIEVLRFAGFAVNSDKTFLFGKFRESCGADWYAEENVTPVYLRGMRKLTPTDIYRVMNGLKRLGIDTPEVSRLLLSAHRATGQPVLRGGWTDDESRWLVSSKAMSLKGGTAKRDEEGRVWCVYAKFTSRKMRCSEPLAYAAALIGQRFSDEERRVDRSADGFWTVGVKVSF